jgi:hypothetical protein
MNTQDFQYLMRRMAHLKGGVISRSVSRFERSMQIYLIKYGYGSRRILLTGVVHGDEPAGAYIISEFLEKHASEYKSNFEFTAIPCVNPTGLHNYAKTKAAFPEMTDKEYAGITRGNGFSKRTEKGYEHVNLNREFKQETLATPAEYNQEARLVMQSLSGKYAATIDLHETWSNATRAGSKDVPSTAPDPDAFLVYESCEDKDIRVGRQIINNVRAQGIEICNWPTVYDDICEDGLLSYPEANRQLAYAPESGTLDGYLWKNFTEHAFTIETPRSIELEKRVNAGITAIKTILDAKYNS